MFKLESRYFSNTETLKKYLLLDEIDQSAQWSVQAVLGYPILKLPSPFTNEEWSGHKIYMLVYVNYPII